MDLLVRLIEAIPESVRLPTIVLAILAWFGLPFLRDWRASKSYWEFRHKELEMTKLYYEIESVKGTANANTPRPPLLDELAAQAERLRPALLIRHPLPWPQRLLLGSLGTFATFLAIAMAHWATGGLTIGVALGGTMVQAVLPAFVSSLVPLQRRSHMLFLGAGAGLLFHVLFIALYLSTK